MAGDQWVHPDKNVAYEYGLGQDQAAEDENGTLQSPSTDV
jgi:hypothetical protein